MKSRFLLASSSFRLVLAIHLAFNSILVLIYIISLLGVFIFIPIVGTYNAFVFGFLGTSALGSATTAAILGFAVFAMTGLLSGWIVSSIYPKNIWLAGFLSLFVTIAFLVGGSLMRYAFIGVEDSKNILILPVTTGRADINELSIALKLEYELVAPPVPPYVPDKESLILFSELQPSLRLLSKEFNLQDGPYVYCNLNANVWRGLSNSASRKKYPLLWSRETDVTGKRLVIYINFETDQFSDELVTGQVFAQMLAELESAIREQTGYANFSFPK